MEKSNNHIYTAEDIKLYLAGKMQPLEMNELEKAALADPFLAEAMEGYELLPEKDWEKELAGLKDKFAAGQTSGTGVIAITKSRNNWRKYAAAVLLIGAGTTTYFMINNRSQEIPTKQFAQTTTADPANPTVSPVTSDSLRKEASTATGTVVLKDETASKTAKPIIAQKNIGTLSKDDPSLGPVKKESNKDALLKRAQLDDFVANNRVENKNNKQDSVSLGSETKSTAVLAEVSPAAGKLTPNAQSKAPLLNQQNASASNGLVNNGLAKKKESVEEINRTFLAQVVGPDNNPLPFANINVTNQGFGTYADVKGNVRLVSTDSIIPVEVKSLGYATQNIILRGNNQVNKIVLKENAMAVSDRVDYSKTTASARKAFPKYNPTQDSTANAEPADGWDNYNTYVLNNTELPDEVLTKNLHGEVEVSFDVKRNGTITNVKVDKSLCNDCDEIAKRLVEQGPQWKVKKGRKAKGKVKVQF